MAMTRKEKYFAIAITALIATGLYAILTWRSSSRAGSAIRVEARDQHTDESLRREVAALRSQVRAVAAMSRELTVSVDSQGGKTSEPAPSRLEGDFLVEEVARLQFKRDTYEGVLAAQGREETWAAETEERISSYFSNAEQMRPGCCEVLSVTCRTSMCKTILRHSGIHGFLDFQHMARAEPFEAAFHVSASDNNTTSTVYSSRKGYPFPFVDESE